MLPDADFKLDSAAGRLRFGHTSRVISRSRFARPDGGQAGSAENGDGRYA